VRLEYTKDEESAALSVVTKMIEILEEDIKRKGEKGNQVDYLAASKKMSVVK
jgi:hypothetical protein